MYCIRTSSDHDMSTDNGLANYSLVVAKVPLLILHPMFCVRMVHVFTYNDFALV